MPTPAQLSAMQKVRETIASGQGANLNAKSQSSSPVVQPISATGAGLTRPAVQSPGYTTTYNSGPLAGQTISNPGKLTPQQLQNKTITGNGGVAPPTNSPGINVTIPDAGSKSNVGPNAQQTEPGLSAPGAPMGTSTFLGTKGSSSPVNIQSQTVGGDNNVPAPFNAGQTGLSTAQNPQSPTTTPGIAQQFPAQTATGDNQIYAQTPQEAQIAGNVPQPKAKVKTAMVSPQQNQNRTALVAQAEKDNAARKAAMGGAILTPPVPGAAPTNLNTSNPQDLNQWQNADPQGFEQWNQEKGWTTQTDPAISAQNSQQISGSLDKLNSTSLDEQLLQILGMGGSVSGATLLKMGLAAQLMTINDPSTSQYLDRMEARAIQSYNQGQDMVNLGEEEINKAIDGTLEAPTTEAGLVAKVNKQTLDLAQANLANDQEYYKKQNEANLKQLRDNRADLEGYAKAKLYSIGAEDSSAGITLLSKTLSAADLQIQLAQADYNHGLTQLNLQGTQILNNYQNAVTGQVLSLKSDRQNLLATYNAQIDKIDESRFMDEKEKRNAKSAAIGQYTSQMATYQQQQKQFEFDQLQFAYKQTQDLKDNAIKYSGLTGTIWVPTDQGPVDTGMPTFDATKWGQQMSLTTSTQRQQMAFNLLGAYGSSAAPAVEQLLGVPQGSLSGQTIAEMTQNINYAQAMAEINKTNAEIQLQNNLVASFMPGGGGGGGISNVALNVAGTNAFAQDFQNNPILQGGALGCAWVASSILTQAGALDKPVTSINELEQVVSKLGWTKSQTPTKDSLVVWGPSPTSQGHRHVGIVTGDNQAVDNWGAQGPHKDTIKQPDRKVDTFWNPPVVSPQASPQQNKSNLFSTIASAFVGAYFGAGATDSQKAFAATAGVQTPQMPQYNFSQEQNDMYARYTLGDKTDYEALATSDITKMAWNKGWHMWLTQHPEFDNASRQIDQNTLSGAQTVQKSLDDSDAAKNFFKIDNAYQAILDPSADDLTYLNFMKDVLGQSNDKTITGPLDQFYNKVLGGGGLNDRERQEVKDAGRILYTNAYKNYSNMANFWDSQSEIYAPHYPGGYKVYRRPALQIPQNTYSQAGQNYGGQVQSSSGILQFSF